MKTNKPTEPIIKSEIAILVWEHSNTGMSNKTKKELTEKIYNLIKTK